MSCWCWREGGLDGCEGCLIVPAVEAVGRLLGTVFDDGTVNVEGRVDPGAIAVEVINCTYASACYRWK
jgi:hypothetical protein